MKRLLIAAVAALALGAAFADDAKKAKKWFKQAADAGYAPAQAALERMK